MSELVVLRRCATLEEALIVDSLLQDGGFISSVPVRYHGANDWFIVAAQNGVPVFVPEIEAIDAGQYILAMRATAASRLVEEFGEIDTAPLKLRWGRAWSMFIIYSGLAPYLLSPLIYLLAMLPIDWQALVETSGQYSYFTPVARSNYDPAGGGKPFAPEGLLFLVGIILYLIWDITDLASQKRMAKNAETKEDP